MKGFYNSCKNKEPTYTKAESTLADGLAVSLVGVNGIFNLKKNWNYGLKKTSLFI